MLGAINALLKRGLTKEQAVDFVFHHIPFKTVYAHLTDIRTLTAGEYEGYHVPVGFNQYVVGGIEQMGKIYNDFDALVVDIKQRELMSNDNK
jgi:hypothetical protein